MVAATNAQATQPATCLVWCFTYSKSSGVDEVAVRWADEQGVHAARIPYWLDRERGFRTTSWPTDMDQETRDVLAGDVWASWQVGNPNYEVMNVAQVITATVSL